MATRPQVFRPGPVRSKADRDRDHDARRRQISDTRRLYGTAAWRRIARQQLHDEPLCRMCMEAGHIALATTCDHVEPHRGDVDKFWSGPFQSLCTTCHNRDKQREEASARG